MNKELEFYINPEGIACISLKEYNDLLEKYGDIVQRYTEAVQRKKLLNNIIKEAIEYIRKQTHDED